MLKCLVLFGALLGFTVTMGLAATPETRPSLLSNGDFAKLEANWPADWPHVEGATWEKEGDLGFLRLTSPQPGQMVMVYRQVILPSLLPPALEVRLRLRHTDIKSGEKEWNDARIIAHFKNEAGRVLKPEPQTPSYRGSSKGWIDYTYIIKVPAHAHLFEIMPALFQVASGTLDLAQCQVFAATADQLPKLLSVASITLVPANPASLPSELHVAGNQLQNKDAKNIWLQGLSVDSLQWSAAGEHIDKSIPVAIDQWKANVIRLPVKENFWAGKGPWQGPDGGVAYRKIVDAAVEAAGSRGAYLVIDLHQFGAPMPEHVEFWTDVATRYKNHPAVLFELFNEPHSISWKVWRDGGDLTDKNNKNTDVNAKENTQETTGEVSTGMQALVNAVRATGARNIIIAGGLDWGYDLSGVMNGYALDDRGGNGIMYSSHVYPWKTDWQGKTLIAADKYPIFVGEVGCPEKWEDFAFIPPNMRQEKLGPGCTWPVDMLGMIQKHKLNWTGFSFHPKCGPMVILDWNYTPTPYWGVFVKDALSGKQFEMQKMR